MNKEITCRMIDGKPVVEYKEEYVPKKGDIVKIVTENRIFLAVHGKYNHYQVVALLNHVNNSVNIEFFLDTTINGILDSHEKATPEESGVMHHILNENGYELKGDTVVKKRWIPKVGEEFYYIYTICPRLFVQIAKRGEYIMDEDFIYSFKSKQAAQSACDKLNEIILTLPQEYRID